MWIETPNALGRGFVPCFVVTVFREFVASGSWRIRASQSPPLSVVRTGVSWPLRNSSDGRAARKLRTAILVTLDRTDNESRVQMSLILFQRIEIQIVQFGA